MDYRKTESNWNSQDLQIFGIQVIGWHFTY